MTAVKNELECGRPLCWRDMVEEPIALSDIELSLRHELVQRYETRVVRALFPSCFGDEFGRGIVMADAPGSCSRAGVLVSSPHP